MHKKTVISFFACMLLASSAVTAAADTGEDTSVTDMVPADASQTDETEEEAIGYSSTWGIDLDAAFNNMVTAVKTGTSYSLSDAFSDYTGMDILDSAYTDLSDTLLDEACLNMSDINLNFNMIATSMALDYDAVDIIGSSSDCMSVFNSAYGDLDLSLTQFEIPDSFDTSAFLSEAKSIVSDTYASALSSDTFSTVKSGISTGSLFSSNNEWFSSKSQDSAYSLTFSEEAQELLKTMQESAEKENKKATNSSKSYAYESAKEAQSKIEDLCRDYLVTSSGSDFYSDLNEKYGLNISGNTYKSEDELDEEHTNVFFDTADAISGFVEGYDFIDYEALKAAQPKD